MGFTSIGVMAAVECWDSASWRTSDDADSAADLVIAFDDGLCADWSAIEPPVLIAKGTAGPIAPPAFARETAATLGANAKLVPFAHVAHGVEMSLACGETIVSAFIRTGPIDGPDVACAATVRTVAFR